MTVIGKTLSAGTFAFGSLTASLALASEASATTLDGTALSLLWVIPFIGILLSIAIFPAVAPQFWHHHCGKVAAFWALAFLLPLTLHGGIGLAAHELLHLLAFEYVPFITLLGALFVAAGGVHVNARFVATPFRNTLLLAGGGLLASLIGTTGAVLLLVSLLVRANQWRQRTTHVYVFFIFIVGNIGGSLTPLGDPPLFIGFLQGVSFFWTMHNLLLPMLLVALPLLVAFFVLDWWRMRGEAPPDAPERGSAQIGGPLIEGKHNLVILAAIIGLVLLSASWSDDQFLILAGMKLLMGDIVRITGLVVLGALSWFATSDEIHRRNEFDWFPLQEVAKLFLGIFVTIVPAIAIIKAGEKGAAAPLLAMLNPAGQPDNMMYFWVTGLLSAFLDNAPTYLIFFNMAGGEADQLMQALRPTLVAISAGAVFMGALTYIGNAPNFMVRSIIERRGQSMPSFFGYMAWSGLFLLPPLVVASLLLF